MGILSGCSHVSTTVRLHHLDFNEAFGEKATTQGWSMLFLTNLGSRIPQNNSYMATYLPSQKPSK